MPDKRPFPDQEYRDRLERVRRSMSQRGMDACLVSSPENIFYLTGLNHQGYFAFQLLIVPLEDSPVLVTRAMEQAIVRDMVPDVVHRGYSDGMAPLPAASNPKEDLLMAAPGGLGVAGLEPWSMSLGVPVRGATDDAPGASNAALTTCQAIGDLGLAAKRLGLEKNSAFLTWEVAEQLVAGLPQATLLDASGLVDDCRLIQSPREQVYTRQAAAVSDAMLLAAIALAGPGSNERDLMAAIYQAAFLRGGTYPGFVPLLRTTR